MKAAPPIHYEIGREEYVAYWPTPGEAGSYYVNCYIRRPASGTVRDTLLDDLTADQALTLLTILEEVQESKGQDEAKHSTAAL